MLLVLTTLAFQVPAARAADYYFTPAHSLNQIKALALPGNRLFLQRGGTWYGQLNLEGKQGTGTTATTQIEIGAYGTGNEPVISTLVAIPNTGWTPLSGGRWSRYMAYPSIRRLYVNGASKYRVNSMYANLNENDVNETTEWYSKPSGNGVLVYVYNGSATVQPSGVEIHVSTSVETLRMKNTRYVKITGLEFRGGSEHTVVDIEAPCHQIAFGGNRVVQSNKHGIRVGNWAFDNPSTNVVTNVFVYSNLVDKVWTTLENQTTSALNGDGIFYINAVDGGSIANNTVTNFGHVGVTLTAYRSGYRGVKNILVQDNNVSGGYSGYCHGIDVTGFDQLVTNNVIRWNFIHNYTSTCHLMGNNNLFYSNIFAHVRETQMGNQHTQDQGWGADMVTFTNDEYGPAQWIVAHDNVIAHNVFYDTDTYSLKISRPPGTPAISNIRIYNNLFVNYGMDNIGENLGLHVSGNLSESVITQHNGFWSTGSGVTPTSPVSWFKNNFYTAAGLNGLPSGECVQNKQVDPVFGNPGQNMFHLQSVASNASLRTGGLDVRQYVPNLTDYFGDPFTFPNPSIGAIQWVP